MTDNKSKRGAADPSAGRRRWRLWGCLLRPQARHQQRGGRGAYQAGWQWRDKLNAAARSWKS